MLYKQFIKVIINTVHNVWTGIFTGGFLSIILNKNKVGFIIILWAVLMLSISSLAKTLIEYLEE